MIGRLTTAPKILLNFEFPKLAMCIVNKRNAQLAASPYARGHDRAHQSYIFSFATALGVVITFRLPDWVWADNENTRPTRLRFEIMFFFFYTGLAAKPMAWEPLWSGNRSEVSYSCDEQQRMDDMPWQILLLLVPTKNRHRVHPHISSISDKLDRCNSGNHHDGLALCIWWKACSEDSNTLWIFVTLGVNVVEIS